MGGTHRGEHRERRGMVDGMTRLPTRLPKYRRYGGQEYQRYGGQDRILRIIPFILLSRPAPGSYLHPCPPVTEGLLIAAVAELLAELCRRPRGHASPGNAKKWRPFRLWRTGACPSLQGQWRTHCAPKGLNRSGLGQTEWAEEATRRSLCRRGISKRERSQPPGRKTD